jgi:hypothetical protein
MRYLRLDECVKLEETTEDEVFPFKYDQELIVCVSVCVCVCFCVYVCERESKICFVHAVSALTRGVRVDSILRRNVFITLNE